MEYPDILGAQKKIRYENLFLHLEELSLFFPLTYVCVFYTYPKPG